MSAEDPHDRTRDGRPDGAPETSASWAKRDVWAAATAITAATILMHLPRVWLPGLSTDDFGMIMGSWPWPVARDSLWEPFNEHCIPTARLLTYGLVEIARSATALPRTMACVGLVTLVVTLVAIYWFVRREMGHPCYALFAVALFGVSSQYNQTVNWFAAVFFLIAFTFTLFGLLAAQRWSQGGRPSALAWCVFFSALASTWNSIGLLAGPLCALYLLIPPPSNHFVGTRLWWKRWLCACVPLLGTSLFLVGTLPFTADRVLHVGHYEDKTTLESFDPVAGFVNGLRSLIDNMVLGTLGLNKVVSVPETLTYILLAPLLIGGFLWWRAAGHRRLLLLGLGFIFLNYLLVYGARAGWNYTQIRHWGRYQVFPHFGMVLFVVGGLPYWRDRLIGTEGRPPRWLRRAWIPILVLLVFAHTQGETLGFYDPKQEEELRRIDAMDRRCREHRVSRDQAVRVLPPFSIAGSTPGVDNCWKLMRGSDNPRLLTDPEAARLLSGPQ